MGKFKDYTGKKYGRLTAINFVERKDKKTYWKCKCDCGNEIIVPTNYLVSGNTKSCGCLNKELSSERLKEVREKGNSKSLVDLTNKRFGRLTVIKRVKNNKFNQVQWLCKCDCGNTKIVRAQSLVGRECKSCGCLKKEQDSINIIKVKHKQCNTRLYNIWKGMKWRCNSPKSKRHKFYYDKGIKVCQEWQEDFMNFYDWAMKNGYKDNLSIDRIDNNKGYSPENCRWANAIQQNNNQSNNIKLSYNNKEYTLSQLSQKYNIKNSTLYSRIKRGWTVEKALKTPVNKIKAG